MDAPRSEAQEVQNNGQRVSLQRLIVALVLAGIVCRVVQYLWRMSYWHDEAFLILNLRELSFGALFGRLPRAQAAPPVFLAVQKGMGELFGAGEYAYRFVPLLLGIAGAILMAVLARRMLSGFGAACAVGLFAFSDRLIWHAAEAKQYSGDATAALVLLLIATWPGVALARRALGVGAISALLVWWSHPVIFMCSGIMLVFVWQAWRGEEKPNWRAMGAAVLGSAVFLISFAALYGFTLRHQEQGSLYAYWAENLADWSRPWTVPIWVVSDLFSLPNYAFEIVTPTMLLASLAGAWTWWTRGRRGALALLTAPILFTLIAALLGRYPFGGSRLTLFLVPGLMILAGAGFDGCLQMARGTKWQALCAVLPAVLIGVGAMQAAMHLVLPRHRSYSRPLAAYVLEHRGPGEPVFVLGAVESFLPYWNETPVPTMGFDQDAPPPASAWFIFNFDEASDWRKAMAEIKLGTGYRMTDEFIVRGGAALRFERVNEATTSPASPATRP